MYQCQRDQDLCQTTMIGLGWLVLFQVIVGLLLLPLLVCVGGHRSKAPAFGHRMVKSPHVLGDPSHLQSSEIDLRPSYDIVKS